MNYPLGRATVVPVFTWKAPAAHKFNNLDKMYYYYYCESNVISVSAFNGDWDISVFEAMYSIYDRKSNHEGKPLQPFQTFSQCQSKCFYRRVQTFSFLSSVF